MDFYFINSVLVFFESGEHFSNLKNIKRLNVGDLVNFNLVVTLKHFYAKLNYVAPSFRRYVTSFSRTIN